MQLTPTAPHPRWRRTTTSLVTASVLALVAGPIFVTASHAETPPKISEISYAGDDSSDFVEISGDPGSDLSGFVVGSTTRGGDQSDPSHILTLPQGTQIPASGFYDVKVSIANSVNSGAQADGKYGSAVFVVDAAGKLADFEEIGGIVGGKGLTAGTGKNLPTAVQKAQATPTGATAPAGQSIQRFNDRWIAAAPTPEAPTADPGKTTPDPTSPASPSDSSSPSTPPTDPDTTPQKETAIADIQGDTDQSPVVNTTQTTRGVVTAAYPDGGLKGYYIQTPGADGKNDPTPGRSDGLFVYSPDTVGAVAVGDYVEVTGNVTEYYGQTQITVNQGQEKKLTEKVEPIQPVTAALPEDAAGREALEGMLLQPTGPITVTDNYDTNRYGEVGLTNGNTALPQSTDVALPGPDANAIEQENAAKEFLLDDGASVDYTRGASNTPVPYLSTTDPVRAGESVTFSKPVVLGYGFDAWRLQPTSWLTGAKPEDSPAAFTNNRQATPQKVGGDVSVASFNVLNYFPTTGDQLTGCKFYTDREKNPITVSGGCDARGAANAENFQRQEQKIVGAINTLDTSVLSLEEIENSARFGKNRDDALHHLVDQLNKAAGTEKWKAVDSPAKLPGNEDVIRTAFIYQPAKVNPVGDSTILLDDPAFDNARRPLAQSFQPTAPGSKKFLAVVNHFKSKGSGTGAGNADAHDGQGASNGSRKAQAQALTTFATQQKKIAGTENVVLLGDFNSYTQEDPMQILYKAGFKDIGSTKTNKHTYLFGGRVGSIDHVLASGPMFDQVKGADVWNINSVESVGLEYSRFNNNVTNLYAPGPYRSSDHDPLLVGFQTSATTGSSTDTPPDSDSDSGDAGNGDGGTTPDNGDGGNQPDHGDGDKQPANGDGGNQPGKNDGGTQPDNGNAHGGAQPGSGSGNGHQGSSSGTGATGQGNGSGSTGQSPAGRGANSTWVSSGTNGGLYDDPEASGSSGQLASTGFTTTTIVIGVVLLLAGLAALYLARRRRVAEDHGNTTR